MHVHAFIQQGGYRDFFCPNYNSSCEKEEVDPPMDSKDLPFQISWNDVLPSTVSVPRVSIHSLVLDFSAVSFLDISAVKGLKMVCLPFMHSFIYTYTD